jgi:hypothetical protein
MHEARKKGRQNTLSNAFHAYGAWSITIREESTLQYFKQSTKIFESTALAQSV